MITRLKVALPVQAEAAEAGEEPLASLVLAAEVV
jgi:hypothetical protein